MTQSLSTDIPQTSGITIYSPATGRVLPLAEVPDPVFAGVMVGDGLAVIPFEETIVAPVDGTIASIFPTGHAVCLKTTGGLEILVHIGIDTSTLPMGTFTKLVGEGTTVRMGDPMVRADLDRLRKAGKSLAVPVLVTNTGLLSGMNPVNRGPSVRAGEPLYRVTLK